MCCDFTFIKYGRCWNHECIAVDSDALKCKTRQFSNVSGKEKQKEMLTKRLVSRVAHIAKLAERV